jgi:hypothetical protein
MSEQSDTVKTTTTTTNAGSLAIEMFSGWFNSGIVTARTAFTFALAKGLEPSSATGFGNAHGGTTWNTANFDPEEHILTLLREFVPEARDMDKAKCYVLIERYIDAGLAQMQKDLRQDPTPLFLL